MKEDFLKISDGHIKYNLINLRQLIFEVTDACNLNCKYCGYGEFYYGYDNRERKKLAYAKASLILDYLAKIWTEHSSSVLVRPVTISFYGGEPLMSMQFIRKVVEHVEKLGKTGKRFFFSMTTNGVLLNRNMDYLAEKEFNLLISLDGCETDHSYRVDFNGRNTHKRVVENIKLLQQTYPNFFQRHVQFNTVLHNRNTAKSAFRYIKDNFGKDTTISPLNDSGIRPDKLSDFLKTYRNVDESIQQADNCEPLETEMFMKSPNISQLANFVHYYSGNVFDSYNDLLTNRSPKHFPPTGTCTPFSKKMFVTVNRKILSCEKVNHEFSWGQVQKNKLDLDLKSIAEKFNDYVFRYTRQCKVCAVNDKCKQCVFQIDDINDEKTKCRSYTSNEEHKAYVRKQLDYLGKHPDLYEEIIKRVVITA